MLQWLLSCISSSGWYHFQSRDHNIWYAQNNVQFLHYNLFWFLLSCNPEWCFDIRLEAQHYAVVTFIVLSIFLLQEADRSECQSIHQQHWGEFWSLNCGSCVHLPIVHWKHFIVLLLFELTWLHNFLPGYGPVSYENSSLIRLRALKSLHVDNAVNEVTCNQVRIIVLPQVNSSKLGLKANLGSQRRVIYLTNKLNLCLNGWLFRKLASCVDYLSG